MERYNVKKRIKPNEEVVAADFIEKLPLAAVTKIFSLVPVKRVFSFFTVKRSWLNLFKGIGYGESDHAVKLVEYTLKEGRDDATGFLLLMKPERNSVNLELYLAEYRRGTDPDSDSDSEFQVSRIRTPVWSSNSNSMNSNKIVGSVNGLLCLAKPIRQQTVLDDFDEEPVYVTVDFDPIFVYNPLLKESIKLPPIQNYSYSHPYSKTSDLAMGFGYHATTNALGFKVYKHKVIRIYYRQQQPEEVGGEVEIFTLGDDVVWRSLANTPYPLQSCSKPGVFVAESHSLYWLINDGPIVSFDLDTETFGVLQPPPNLPIPDADTSTYLKEFGGKLCVNRVNQEGHLSFWILMNEDVADPWIFKQMTLDNFFGDFNRYQPYYLRRNTEEVLMSCSTLTREEVLGLSRFSDRDYEPVEVLRMAGKRMDDIFPHTQSYVSLMELGGEIMPGV